MVRLIADQNFNDDIIRGLLLRQPDLDLIRVRDVGLGDAEDPDILAWAAANGRIVLTHDQSTFPDFAWERVRAGEPMPGVFVLNDRVTVRRAIDDLLIVNACSEHHEWANRVAFLPL